MKLKVDKLDFISIRNFYASKDTISKMKIQPKEGEKTFANHISNKGFVS